MGRPMRPIDPAGGIAREFAAELRQLRESAGNPPFRQLARRAHYSATTLSVACSGTALPSLDVTLALVRACDGPADLWLQRWHDADGAAKTSRPPGQQPAAATNGQAGEADSRRHGASRGARKDGRPGIFPRRHRGVGRASNAFRGSRFVLAGLMVAASVAGAATWAVTHSPHPPSLQQVSAGAAKQTLYVGVSPCDIGAVILSQAEVKLPSRLAVGGRYYSAGTVIGEVALRFSPRCALAWARFLPDSSFGGDAFGSVTLRSRRAADGAVSILTVSPVVASEGDPLLTVPGCVLAQATIRFGPHHPAAVGTTGCYP
ncbi:MAG TPA: helix-turn-helix transcriptional regulator [Streptosporangiaceae bacterium]|nr:helix-turn-helix transcriptional regulator [Streptosporangiaceae bacterium]